MASGHSRRFDIEQAESSQNVEDNVETSLQLRHLDSKTPLWQHDNAWIRLPVQYIRWAWFHRVPIAFISLLLVFGILLLMSTGRGVFSPALLIIESYMVILGVIYFRIVGLSRGPD
ncbi:hypothetical protein F4680DRAFT_77926 [Xylaria scruposa]|nr:hypothetical protein F4680DRAFT_77926 [Xylaria scruposa]